MVEILKNIFKVPDLRKKILYTILIILIFRVGSTIPVPYLNLAALKGVTLNNNNFFAYIDTITGGAFSKGTVFSLSISPYITSSIVIQLLTFGIPALERLAKEGEEGRRKISKLTRYFTVILGIIQGFTFYQLLRGGNAMFMQRVVAYTSGFDGIFAAIVIILTFTAGSALVMWMGEKINDNGIGNGISILLFAGILSRGPSAVLSLWHQFMRGGGNYILVPFLLVLIILIMIFTVFMTNAERKIPIQYAQRVVGRKMYGGQSTHIPIKVNMSGVMPIIFASSLLAFFSMLRSMFNMKSETLFAKILSYLEHGTLLYSVLYFLLIIAFNFFYVSMQYNPIEIANNLRKNNGMVPGIRPGKQTSDFLDKIIWRVTFIGALFLGFIAISPMIISAFSGYDNMALGGTTLLIVIGVALDTMKQIESMMMMKNYKGFLE